MCSSQPRFCAPEGGGESRPGLLCFGSMRRMDAGVPGGRWPAGGVRLLHSPAKRRIKTWRIWCSDFGAGPGGARPLSYVMWMMSRCSVKTWGDGEAGPFPGGLQRAIALAAVKHLPQLKSEFADLDFPAVTCWMREPFSTLKSSGSFAWELGGGG